MLTTKQKVDLHYLQSQLAFTRELAAICKSQPDKYSEELDQLRKKLSKLEAKK